MRFIGKISAGSLCAAAVLTLAACSSAQDAVDTARTAITRYLTGQGIYERNFVPDDSETTTVSGYYDIVGGAFRFIENEDREGRNTQPEIVEGSLVEFWFDARIFSSNFANSATFYTNIESQIKALAGTNYEFNTEFWPMVPLRIRIGEGTILKSLENALLSCRQGDKMQIYLTSDIGFGDRKVGIVPGGSTLVYQISDIVVLE